MSAHQRAHFLARVATAVKAGNKYREASRRELPQAVGYLSAGDDPTGRLAEELVKVGAQPVRVQSHKAAAAAVRALAERIEGRRAVCNAGRILDELGVVEILRACGVAVTTTEDLAKLDESLRRETVFAADLGIASPDWAIAETGSLVYVSGPTQSRSATLLPPIHLAVVDSRTVLPDLLDITQRLQGKAVDGVLPRNIAIVTGPSKTGDIELKLTTGVHGPGEVHVLIWERE